MTTTAQQLSVARQPPAELAAETEWLVAGNSTELLAAIADSAYYVSAVTPGAGEPGRIALGGVRDPAAELGPRPKPRRAVDALRGT